MNGLCLPELGTVYPVQLLRTVPKSGDPAKLAAAKINNSSHALTDFVEIW